MAIAALALACSAAIAQDAEAVDQDQILNDTALVFFDALPAEGGSELAASTAAELPTDEDLVDARYVQVTYQDRSYLFGVAGVAQGKEITLDLTVDEPLEGAEPTVNLQDVVLRLAGGLEGREDALVTSRREGDVNVITGLYGLDGVNPESAVDVEPGTRLLVLRGGAGTLHDVQEAGTTLADIRVGTDEDPAPLAEEGAWREGDPADGEPGLGAPVAR